MYWIDSTMFNGEPVVQLRLKYLSPYVDKFYICEQRYTHQGERKKELFIEKYKDWFVPYLNKIVLLVDENKYTLDSWGIENEHRRYAIPFIQKDYIRKQYILSVCDMDEIPNAEMIMNNKDLIYTSTTNGAIYPEQKMFYYNLNWFVDKWIAPFFVNNRTFDSFPDIQIFRNKEGYISGVIENCGWHLSYFLDKYGIQRKIKSFAHKEFNTEEYTDINFIEKSIKDGNLLYPWNPINNEKYLDKDFPKEFLEFNDYILKLQE